MHESISKSPLQEKKIFLLTKYNKFKDRKVYTFTIQMKIKAKIRDDNFKEI
jgi:hypothetical protein